MLQSIITYIRKSLLTFFLFKFSLIELHLRLLMSTILVNISFIATQLPLVVIVIRGRRQIPASAYNQRAIIKRWAEDGAADGDDGGTSEQ